MYGLSIRKLLVRKSVVVILLDLAESWTTKNVPKRASLRPDSISNDLPPPKRRKCAMKGCVNSTKTVCHICHLHTSGKCGQASNKVTQCNTCFDRARAHQRAELSNKYES